MKVETIHIQTNFTPKKGRESFKRFDKFISEPRESKNSPLVDRVTITPPRESKNSPLVDRVTITPESRNMQRINAESEIDKPRPKAKEMKPAGILLRAAQRNFDYYINDNDDLAIKVIDKETGEVLREIPFVEQQKLSAAINELIEKRFSGE